MRQMRSLAPIVLLQDSVVNLASAIEFITLFYDTAEISGSVAVESGDTSTSQSINVIITSNIIIAIVDFTGTIGFVYTRTIHEFILGPYYRYHCNSIWSLS